MKEGGQSLILILPALALAGCFSDDFPTPGYIPQCDQYAPAHWDDTLPSLAADKSATLNLAVERGWKNVTAYGSDPEAKTIFGAPYHDRYRADCPEGLP